MFLYNNEEPMSEKNEKKIKKETHKIHFNSNKSQFQQESHFYNISVKNESMNNL